MPRKLAKLIRKETQRKETGRHADIPEVIEK
jgi:hypothetical protein